MTTPYGLMADLHLHEWSSFATVTPDGQNSRLVALISEIRRCAEEVHAAGGNQVIMAGDIYHVRGQVRPSVQNALIDCLNDCERAFDTRFIILAGNHDIQHKDTTRLGSAITALEGNNVRVCNQAHIDTDIGVMLMPWVENIDSLKEEIEALIMLDAYSHEDFDLILHAPIDGVIAGLPPHGLTPEFLADLGMKRVLSGHYHNHKKMHSGANLGAFKTADVYSIGALAHHTWSDVGSKAGYLLVYPDRVDWRKSHLPEFIDLSQLVDLSADELPLIVDGNFIRVKVEASKSKDVEAARQELLDMGAKAVIVQAMPKPPAREGSEIRPTVASGASLEVSVSEFIKAMGATDERSAEVTKAAIEVLASVDVE